jgi:predicted phage terminase large subunit-like protein
MKKLTKAEYHALLRLDLYSFIQKTFMELNPQTGFLHNWHIELIASRLTDVAEGRTKRLIINVPPRSLKSICASVAFPAWLLGNNPSKKIICTSYGQSLVNKLAGDCRSVMNAPWYQEMFPGTVLTRKRNQLSDFETTAHGYRLSTSTGSGLTGRGADILIIDDPIKPDEAYSEVTRKNVNDWFDGTASTRLDSKVHGAIVVVMQRLHMDDLTGHLIEQSGWEILSLPAIAEEDETHCYNHLIFGKKVHHRQEGTPLHPEREPLDILLSLKRSMSDYWFSAQYQQKPVPQGGAIIKCDWLQYYDEHELPSSFEYILQSWDTASKEHHFANYSVCTTWGMKNKKLFLLDVFRARLEYPALKKAALEQYRKFKPNEVVVEDKSSGMALIQDLKDSQIYCIKAIKPEGDKLTRFFAQAGLFESGTVLLPRKAPWLAEYIHELTSFPTVKFDDQVDSTSQALKRLKEQLDTPGLLRYYEERVKKSRNGVIV